MEDGRVPLTPDELRAVRELLGLSLRDAAEQSNGLITAGALGRVERRDELQSTSLQTLFAVSIAYGHGIEIRGMDATIGPL